MPFSNSPSYSTYKTVQLNFEGTSLFRSGDITTPRDTQLVNFYYERISQENEKKTISLKKRPGVGATTWSLTKVANSDVLRGSTYDTVRNAMYWAVGNKVYSLLPDVSNVPTLVTTLSTSSGYVGFCGYIKSTGTRYICFSDGTDLWIHDYVGATCTKVVDADMPTPHQPYPISVDGYILLVKLNTNDMYNSDPDNPFSWTAGNYISAEINSDYSIRPIKVKNYVLLLGVNSVEYFYDAANASGSPFSRNDSPYRSLGYVTGYAQAGDTSFFVGQEGQGNLSVYQVNGFKIERISTNIVDQTIQTNVATQNAKSPIITNKDANIISVAGHTFYVLTASQTTWMYDLEEKFWYELRNSSGTGMQIEASWNMQNGSQYLAIANQPTISVMAPALYQDFGVNFTCRYTTDNYTADTMNWKFCSRLIIVADQTQSTGASYINVSWSDDDFADPGTPVQLNLFTTTPDIRQLGRFRQRTWRFEYTDNYPLRMQAIYMDLNVGNS